MNSTEIYYGTIFLKKRYNFKKIQVLQETAVTLFFYKFNRVIMNARISSNNSSVYFLPILSITPINNIFMFLIHVSISENFHMFLV